MTLENLAKIGRLQLHASTRVKIAKLLNGATRSLKDAGNTSIADASRLVVAYTAIMEAAQVALFADGYRTSKSESGHHMTMVQSLVHSIGVEPARMRVLDTIRHKRNAVDYTGDDVEPSDVREAVASATALLADVNAWLAKNHPALS